jgi:hypothetical protein
MVDKMSTTAETIVYALKGVLKYSKDGHFVDLPDDWEFVPSGDPALTRRLKAVVTDYWVVKRKLGRKEFGVGLCIPMGLSADIAKQLKSERETPEYQRKLEADRRRREKKQEEYKEDFEKAILDFLCFHERYGELAARLAKTVTAFTIPVGSGTVARTQRIPIEQRARAAVIAWMRHNTTDYDHRCIPHVKGKRREVRRDLAQASLALLTDYRRGNDVPDNCPLKQALNKMEQHKTGSINHFKEN